jgi:exodeoxyribonuclease VII large subunit
MQAVDALAKRLVHPAARLRASRQNVVHLGSRLAFALSHRLHSCGAQLERLRTALSGLDPGAVLARGYSITRDAQGKVIADSAQVAEGEVLNTTLARGWIESAVRRKG